MDYKKSRVRIMSPEQKLVTIKYRGTRYRGTYYIAGNDLVVEAHDIGKKSADAALLDYKLDTSAAKLAKILLMELVKEGIADDPDLMLLASQGSTTQITICGSTTQITL